MYIPFWEVCPKLHKPPPQTKKLSLFEEAPSYQPFFLSLVQTEQLLLLVFLSLQPHFWLNWWDSRVYICVFYHSRVHNNTNWVSSILTHNLWLIFTGGEAKEKKNQNGRLRKFKMATSKKPCFPATPSLNILSWNFYGLVLGLVDLIHAKGIDVA